MVTCALKSGPLPGMKKDAVLLNSSGNRGNRENRAWVINLVVSKYGIFTEGIRP